MSAAAARPFYAAIGALIVVVAAVGVAMWSVGLVSLLTVPRVVLFAIAGAIALSGMDVALGYVRKARTVKPAAAPNAPNEVICVVRFSQDITAGSTLIVWRNGQMRLWNPEASEASAIEGLIQ